jgi:hypothetical protein
MAVLPLRAACCPAAPLPRIILLIRQVAPSIVSACDASSWVRTTLRRS